jgi:cobaltochelatase CobS
MNYKDIIQEVDAEILGAKEALIKKAIREELARFKFSEQNLSQSLINTLMEKSSVTIPIPEVKKSMLTFGSMAQMDVLFPSETSQIYSDLMVGNNVYLYGKAGTGKTTLAKNIARVLLKRPSYVINCNQFTSPINIIGGQTIEGYKQGGLSLAWENGGVLILDELPKLDPNTAGLLNEALASAADEEKVIASTKNEYDEYHKLLVKGESLDYDIITRKEYEDRMKENEFLEPIEAEYIKFQYVTITDGSGKKLIKNKFFCVIGTGNTDMKSISVNFSGNNRQDYSLVDRFAGSFYEIKYDEILEKTLIYNVPLEVSRMLRDVLDESDALESISLRTMLNFSRIYEQQGLKFIDANEKIRISEYKGKEKTLFDAVKSFVDTLPKNMTENNQRIQNALSIAQSQNTDIIRDEFIQEFMDKHKRNPFTLEPVA